MTKLYVLQQNSSGVQKFRIEDPHICLQKMFPEEYDLEFIGIKELVDGKLDEGSVLFIHNSIMQEDNVFQKVKLLKPTLKIIIDIDDFWDFPINHPLKKFAERTNLKTRIKESLKIADLVTCTTQTLKNKVRLINPNCQIIENAIDLNERQFQSHRLPSTKIRIGYVAGSTHLEDIKLLRGLYSTITRKYNNVEFKLCGFDSRTKNTKTGKIESIYDGSIWHQMETIFTDNYSELPKRYTEYLHTFDGISDIDYGQPYKRVWTKPIKEYAENYNDIDIALVPLVKNGYNECKSELKLLEAGTHGCAVICSDVLPYTSIGTHNEDCLVVPDAKKHKAWIQLVEKLILDEALRQKLGENLRKKIVSDYDLKKITEKRKKIYDSLVGL